MPDENPTRGQGPNASVSQPPPGVSSAAQWYMGLKAEATPGTPPAVAPGGNGDGGQGANAPSATADGGAGGEFNWELFPDVPEEQRPLLEPHLRNTQAHVTRLEQQYAPYKGLIDAGLPAEDVQNIINLNASFERDPVGTWIWLAQMMQQSGSMGDELDLEAVQAILNGEDGPSAEEGEPAAQEGDDEIPSWARQIQQENEERADREAQQSQTAEAQQRQAQLDQALEGMRGQLTEAGFGEEDLSENLLVGAIIANQGDPEKALQELVSARTAILKGLSNGSKGPGDEEGPDMPKGSPKAPKRAGRGPGREYADARAGAEQFLRGRLGAEAQ